MTQKNAGRGGEGGVAKEAWEGDDRAAKPRTSELLYLAQIALASIWNVTQVSEGYPSRLQVLRETENHLI